MDNYDIIKYPSATEKSTKIMEDNNTMVIKFIINRYFSLTQKLTNCKSKKL